jgi:hypothetical protein
MEQEKNAYKTYFMDTNVSCFVASKIFWKEIDIYSIDNDYYRGYETFVCDEEDRISNYRRFVRVRENTVTMNGKEWNFNEDEPFTKSQIKEVKKNTKKITVNCEFVKKAICCPQCHKVHYIEDFVTIKESKKQIIEEIKNTYGEHWYSLFACDHNINPNKYFESLYENFEGYSLTKDYYEKNPEAKSLYSAFEINYYNNDLSYFRFFPKLTCPECGCLVNTYPFKRLSIFNKFTEDNSILNAITIFNDENKIAVSGLFRCYYLNVDALTIARDEYRVRLTLNTETGQSYFIGPKKLNGKRMSGWNSSYLINLTYRTHGCPYPMETILRSSLVKRELLKLLMEKNGDTIEKFKSFPIFSPYNDPYFEEPDAYVPEEIKEIYDIDFSSVPLSWITLYNRFPCLNGEQIKNLYPERFSDYCADNYFMKDLFRGVKRNYEAKELLETVMKNAKVPSSKKIKKIIASDLMKANSVLFFIKCGFKDINIIQRFIELPTNKQESFKHCVSKAEFKMLKTLIVDLIEKKGESKTFSALFSDTKMPSYYIVDTARMYVKFKAENMLIKEYYTDSLRKIHDRLSRDYPKIKYKNQIIEYPKKSEKYNMVIDEKYEFSLAEDTNELVRIGQELKICVGGYRDVALNGSSRIVSIKQEGKYVGCIQLSSNFKQLIQAKAFCNNRLQEYKAYALKEWVEKLEIDAKDCYDYEHIASGDILFEEDNIYTSRQDYHRYELDEEGNVVNGDYLPFM